MPEGVQRPLDMFYFASTVFQNILKLVTNILKPGVFLSETREVASYERIGWSGLPGLRGCSGLCPAGAELWSFWVITNPTWAFHSVQ